MKQAQGRNPVLDALRGIAAFSVFIFHLVQQHGDALPTPVKWIALKGYLGVQLFYILSAITLFLTLHSRFAKQQVILWKDFFIRRFFRIAPLFYCALLFYLWLYGMGPRYALGSQKAISTLQIASTVFFLNGFHPYWINSIVPVGWSVAVEVIFYCTVPFLFLTIRNMWQAILAVVFYLELSCYSN